MATATTVGRDPPRILVISNLTNSLTTQRAVVGRAGGYAIFWYSIPCSPIDNVDGYDGPPAIPNRLFQHALSPFYLARALRRFQPDLIHVHWAIQRLLTPFLIHFHPLVVTVMGGDILPERRYRGINRIFVKQLLDSADVITSKSLFMDNALKAIGPYEPKIRRITWGVDFDKFQPGLDVSRLRQQWELTPDDFVFFCARNCRELYNKHLVIQAFAECLKNIDRSVKLLVVEASPNLEYNQRLKKMVAELGIKKHIRFVGTIPHAEMPLYFNLANVAISIPRSDGMPQSLYEAMACGTFHILSDLPQYDELIQTPEMGYLVSVDGIASLSRAMCWSVEHFSGILNSATLRRDKIRRIANADEQTIQMNHIYAELLKKYESGKDR